MKFRTHKMSTNVVYGVGLAGFTTIVFFLMNAGIDPRAHRVGDFDPAGAGIVGIGLYGLYHTIAIIFFNEDDSSDKDAPAPDHHVPRAPDSYTGFIRQAWYKVFSVGPIWAFFSAASIFIWHSFAKSTGTPGTIWGDYSASPLPALVIFFACWLAVNLGFTLSAVAEAFNRDHPAVFIIMLVTMFLLGIGLTFVFMFPIPEMSTGSGLSLVTITLPLSLLALFGTRLWAVVRVARCDERILISARGSSAAGRGSIPGTRTTAVPEPAPFNRAAPFPTRLRHRRLTCSSRERSSSRERPCSCSSAAISPPNRRCSSPRTVASCAPPSTAKDAASSSIRRSPGS